MRIVRDSSLQEYASWYLLREARKGDSRWIPADPERQVEAMWRQHQYKMRTWFSADTRWYIVTLDPVGDVSNLVFLESSWTREEGLVVPDGPNNRLLDRVAANAMSGHYLTRASAQRHKAYYERLEAGALRLEGDDRVAICSAEPSETSSNPAARYYLLDGVGRCLPYMILLKEQKRVHAPVEAFLAERGSA